MRAIHHGDFPSDSLEAAPSQGDLLGLVQRMSDIARQISRFSEREDGPQTLLPYAVDARLLRRMMYARRARSRFFEHGLFADPAWDMLLDLYAAHLTQMRVSVTDLCNASNVPPTTALRWLKTLEGSGLAARRADPIDGRRYFIELTAKSEEAMKNYFASIGIEFVV